MVKTMGDAAPFIEARLNRNLEAVEYEEIDLAADEWLSDRPPVIRCERAMLVGETSIGKTSYVLGLLASRYPVILLLPTVSQTQQIAVTWAAQELSVVHARCQPESLQRTIVATYDQLPTIRRKLGAACADYLLVVDEVHKVYQAGSYRAKALQGLLEAIDTLGQPGGFRCFLGLSATLQPDLLDFTVGQWIVVRKPARWVRQVAITEYQEIDAWVETLLRQDLLPLDALNVIRLNDVQRLQALEAFFTERGYRCLVVHSQVQDEEEIQQMLAGEAVATDCQLLLTTSLLDEGINLQNENLGCVHLIGDIHSGELHQFLGRFRQCNPDVFLHIAILPEAGEWIDLEEQREIMLDFQQKTVVAWHALQTLSAGPGDSPLLTVAKQLNPSYRRYCHFDPLIVRRGADEQVEILPNRPGLLGYLYEIDTRNHYCSLSTLIERLELQLVNCEIQVYRVGVQPSDQAFENDLRAASALVDQQRQALLKTLEKRLARAVATGRYACPLDALEGVVTTVTREHTLDSALRWLLWELATQVAADYETALAMLRANHQRQVWRFVNALDDVLIRAFHQELAVCRAEYAPNPEDFLVIPRAYGKTLVLNALAAVTQRDPHYQVSAQLVGTRSRGVDCDAAGVYAVTPQFVTKLFRDYTESEIKHDAYHYRSPAWGGYRYRAFSALRVPRTSALMPKRASRRRPQQR